MAERVLLYRVTGARRAVCGLEGGAMLEVAFDAPVPVALYGASPLRPLAARIARWGPDEMEWRCAEALLLLDDA